MSGDGCKNDSDCDCDCDCESYLSELAVAARLTAEQRLALSLRSFKALVLNRVTLRLIAL